MAIVFAAPDEHISIFSSHANNNSNLFYWAILETLIEFGQQLLFGLDGDGFLASKTHWNSVRENRVIESTVTVFYDIIQSICVRLIVIKYDYSVLGFNFN